MTSIYKYIYYDDSTLKYIKKKELKITDPYLYTRDTTALSKKGNKVSSSDHPWYENKLIQYDSQFKYISLFEVIIELIEKGMVLDEIYEYLSDNYPSKHKITPLNISFVYLDTFEKNDYNLFVGKNVPLVNYEEKKKIFDKNIKMDDIVAKRCTNVIQSLLNGDKLTSSVVLITKKKLLFTFETDISNMFTFFNSIHLFEDLPYKELKNNEIVIYPEINFAEVEDFIYKKKHDITLLLKLNDSNTKMDIDFKQKSISLELNSNISSKKVIEGVQKSIPLLKNLKTSGTGGYLGSFNLYGMDFNHILLSYAIMNIKPFNQLLYINETDSDPFVISKKRSQYHMNSIGSFFDKKKSERFTKNESIIRFSMTNEKHNTSTFVKIPVGDKIVNQSPPTYQHIVVNFSHGQTLKDVYILREYLIRLFKLYIEKEKDIKNIYMSYGLKFNTGVIITGPEEEIKEITKYRQFDYYDSQQYTKTCSKSKRPKIINENTYNELLPYKSDSLMVLKNKQGEDVHLYCPYEDQSKIVFESGRPCCYNSNYKVKAKKITVSTKKYKIKQSKIVNYLKTLPVARKVEITVKSCLKANINMCIQKILKIKVSPNKTVNQIENLYKINVVIIETTTTGKIRIKPRNRTINCKYKSIVLIEHANGSIYYEYVVLTRGGGAKLPSKKKFNPRLGKQFTLKLKELYEYEYDIELVQSLTDQNVTSVVSDINLKLNYHQIVRLIPTKYKNQIIDVNGKLRCIVLNKSSYVKENIYMCVLPTETEDISGKIIKITTPIYPDYKVVYDFFEYYPFSVSKDEKNRVIGFWYYHLEVYNSFYCPIKPIKTSRLLKLIVSSNFINNVQKSPSYIFSGLLTSSVVERNHILKQQTQNILTLVSYLYSISGLELSSKFESYLETKVINKDSIDIYNLDNLFKNNLNLVPPSVGSEKVPPSLRRSEVSVRKPHRRSLNLLHSKLDMYSEIVPTLVQNRKIICYSDKMKRGILYYLENYQQNKTVFEYNLRFIQPNYKREIRFSTAEQLKSWFFSKNKYKVYDDLHKFIEVINPIIYVVSRTDRAQNKSMYYLIQKVENDSFERCVYVTDRWRNEKINYGYNAPEYEFSVDNRGKVEIPYHVILKLNSSNKIIFGKEDQKNILMILAYSGKRFAAVLPL